jgi:hypothetical protein
MQAGGDFKLNPSQQQESPEFGFLGQDRKHT